LSAACDQIILFKLSLYLSSELDVDQPGCSTLFTPCQKPCRAVSRSGSRWGQARWVVGSVEAWGGSFPYCLDHKNPVGDCWGSGHRASRQPLSPGDIACLG